jgi:serine/threonine-protein kinase
MAVQLPTRRHDQLLIVTIIVALAALGVGLAAFFGGSAGVASNPSTHPPAVRAQITVPNVLGQSKAQAEAALSAAGLHAQVYSEQSSNLPAGTIFVQSPPAGSSTARRGIVTLRVSSGPAAPTSSSP